MAIPIKDLLAAAPYRQTFAERDAAKSSNGSTPDRYGGRRVDIAARLAKPPQPIPWRVHGFVADSTLTILSGESGSGKSWLAMALCVGVARGHAVAGLACSKAPALYVDGEMGPMMFIDQRMRPAGIGAEFELRDAMGLDISLPADLAWLRGEIQSTGAKFVVIDSLRRLVPSKPENESDAMAPTISALAKLARDTKAAVLLVHHKGDSEKFYRGSTAIRDQCDALFALLRDSDDEDDGVRRLTCGGGKGKMRYAIEPRDVFLEIAVEQGGVIAAGAPAAAPTRPTSTTVRQEILDSLPCATKTEAARKIGRSLNDRTFREVWAELERAGAIAPANGKGVVVVVGSLGVGTTTTPFDGLEDLGPEQPDDTLADALPAGVCRCLPAPSKWTDPDGDIRCAKCGRAAR